MDIGPFEIGIILVLILLVVLMARINRMRKLSSRKNNKSGGGTGSQKHNYGNLAGLGLVLLSVILLWYGIRALRVFFWSLTSFVVLLAAGVAVLVLFRKRN